MDGWTEEKVKVIVAALKHFQIPGPKDLKKGY